MPITLKDASYWLFIIAISLSPIELTEHLRVLVDKVVLMTVIYTLYSSIPALVSWFQTILDMNDHQSRVSDLEYKIDILQERVNTLEHSRRNS